MATAWAVRTDALVMRVMRMYAPGEGRAAVAARDHGRGRRGQLSSTWSLEVDSSS